MWVADRGFTSAANRRELRRGDGHYIIGEKLHSGSAEATAALSRQGRHEHVRDNSLPGTLASPRTGHPPAGNRELVARLRHSNSFTDGARTAGRTWLQAQSLTGTPCGGVSPKREV
jgi:hypothetical protein